MAAQFVKSSIEDSIAVVTIDRPPVNALNPQTLDELGATMAELEGDDQVKVIIVTGGGQRAFVAGADINDLLQRRGDPQAARDFLKKGQDVFNRIEGLSKPVIAAINGFCLGGGNELAMACHIRLASDRARFGQPEINLGIIPGFGGTQRTPRIVGKGPAFEMMLTGDMIPAAEALRIGLISRIVSEGSVVDAAKELAKKITAKSRIALQSVLDSVNEGMEKTLKEGLDVELRDFARALQSEDAKEGLTAFLENRPPKFQDK